VGGRGGQHADVRKRIAVQHDQVRPGARRERTEFVHGAEHPGGYERGGADDLKRRLHLGPDAELLVLVPVHAAKQVRAVDQLDAAAVRELERAQAGLQDVVHLAPARLGQAELPALALQRPVRHQGRHEERVVPGEQRHALVVDEVAVLDRPDPGRQRAVHRPGRVRVRRHVPVARRCLVDDGAQFLHRVLHGVDPVGRRRDATGRHDLDVVTALAQFVTRREADGVHAVRDPAGRRRSVRVRPAVVAGAAVFAVPAGLAQPASAEVQPRSADQALGLGGSEPEVGAGHVADRGEAAVQHPAHDPGRVRAHIERRHRGDRGQVGGEGGDVHMAVDEAGEDEGTAQVADLCVVGRGQPGPGLGDPAVNREQVAFGVDAGHHIKEPAVTQQQRQGHLSESSRCGGQP
jgi:hypothetical protein